MKLNTSLKYIEQLAFSSLSFGSVFILGLLLPTQEFFDFSLIFTYLQGVLLICFSYVSNPFLVFYSSKNSHYRFKCALKLSIVFALVAVLGLAFYLMMLKSVSVLDSLGISVILVWLYYDVFRKKHFASGEFKVLTSTTLFIGVAYIITLLILNVIERLSSANALFALLGCFLAGIVLLHYFNRDIALGKHTKLKGYLYFNHNYAKWSVISAFSAWFLSSGLLLLAEHDLSKELFNAVRLLLSFIGLTYLVTNVFENQLIVKLSKFKNLDTILVSKEISQIAVLSACLSGFILIVSYLSFKFLYSQYFEFFWQIAILVFVAFFHTLSKPFTASLKVFRQINKVFYSFVLAALASFLFYGLSPLALAIDNLIGSFVVGSLLLVISLAYFVNIELKSRT